MITISDIREAAARIAPYILRTPLSRVPALDSILGCEVYLKPESLQYTGSFKLRGATNALLCLNEEERARGIVCCSSGNHAQGVACAAARLGIDAIVVMPENANPVKLAGVRAFGATIQLAGVLDSERNAAANRLAEAGRVMIPPYDNDRIRAGQGTIALEILADQPQLDTVVVPLGGGGLLSGIAVGAKSLSPTIRTIGAEPAGARRYGLSRQAGHPVVLETVDTIADGTRTDRANPNSFSILEHFVDQLVSTEDAALRDAIRLLALKAKLIAEPSAALGVAAALSGSLRLRPTEKVCFVLSGGNIDPRLLTEILSEA